MDTLTIEEARKRLGIGRSLVYRLVASGQLPSIRLGRAIRIPREAFNKMLSNSGEAS